MSFSNRLNRSKTAKMIDYTLTVILLIGMSIYSFATAPMSEKRAEKLLNEKFELYMELIYPSEPHFKWSEEMVLIKEDYCYEILNYETICNKYFTPNAKQYFDEHAICVIFKDDKAYITEGGEGYSGFGGIEFENIYITTDSIVADAVQTRVDLDGDFKGKIKTTFGLVKVDNEWKIDAFADVEDLDEWVEYE
ncbi:MAG: hypothetical protein IJW20_06850 [Clostridia bacterium]|nr:hypothetical protein [Clostridia bacterium]